ncbi:MAG: hypothetical protein ACK4V4_00430 [Sphingobacteriales bacterium]|jgi:hypothetical protein
MFISYRESLVNLNYVAHIHLFENEIHFIGKELGQKDENMINFESWYFKSNEEAEIIYNKLLVKVGAHTFD